MFRWYSTVLLFALAAAGGCQHMNRGPRPAHEDYAKVTFQIRGMMKAKSGAT